MTLLKDAVEAKILSQAALDSFMSSIKTVSQELNADAAAVNAGEMKMAVFVEKYGHLRPGTYDITSPRYDAEPELFIYPLVRNTPDTTSEKVDRTAWNQEKKYFFEELFKLGIVDRLENVEPFLKGAIEGREYAKFVFTKSISRSIEILAEVAEELGFTREEIANVPVEDLLQMRSNIYGKARDVKIHLGEQIKHHQMLRAISSTSKLPSLLWSEEDFHCFLFGSSEPNFFGSRRVIAEIVELNDQSSVSFDDLNDKLIIIPNADPGFDWIFGSGMAAFVTCYGGANSHMAIRAAEFKITAAIGVGEEIYEKLRNANSALISPVDKTLQVLGMNLKRIAITQRRDFISHGNESRDALDVQLPQLFWQLGALPVPLCSGLARPHDYLQQLQPDGIVLSGGNDIGSCKPRDELEVAALNYATTKNLSVLGICRGMQFINHFLGGQIVPVDKHVAVRHEIEGSICQNRVVEVNSFHHFGILESGLAPSLIAVACDAEGFVEAFTHKTLPWLGIMWHPERESPFMDFDLDLIQNLFEF